jgi:hypothetical protein
MEGDRQFHDAEAGADVPPRSGADIDEPLANGGRKLAQLVPGHRLDVGWGAHSVEN